MHFQQLDKVLQRDPLLFDVIYLDLKELLIDKKLFITAQYSNGSKK